MASSRRSGSLRVASGEKVPWWRGGNGDRRASRREACTSLSTPMPGSERGGSAPSPGASPFLASSSSSSLL